MAQQPVLRVRPQNGILPGCRDQLRQRVPLLVFHGLVRIVQLLARRAINDRRTCPGNFGLRGRGLVLRGGPCWQFGARASRQAQKKSKRQAHAKTPVRSEEHTSELQSLMRISYAVFCLKTKNNKSSIQKNTHKTQQ